MDKTGRALGTLDPIYYFENASGYIVLAAIEVGHGPAGARKVYEEQFRPKGFEWCEADTLPKVQRLQQRLIDQENRVLQQQGHADAERRRRAHAKTASDLRQRMASSSCSAYEREFISLWLGLTESKQKEYTQRFTERNMYIHALEFDSSTKVQDRMGE